MEFFTNSNNQLLQKQVMCDVNPDQWYIWNLELSKWIKTPNPTLNYFDKNGMSCKITSSIGLCEISKEKAELLKSKYQWEHR